MTKLTILAVFSALLVVANCFYISMIDRSEDSANEFETSQELLDAAESGSLSEFKLNNETTPSEPTNVTLSMTNRNLQCSIENLIPNNGYVVTFFRNDIAFGFYKVSPRNIIWSTMNLNTILDFYPAKGAVGAYPNFTVDFSDDSKLYGDYQCSVELLGIKNDGDKIVYNSNRVVIVKDKAITPEMKWQKVFPVVNITFGLDKNWFTNSSVYEAKCKVRFDRPVSEYIVYFMSSNKTLGAYMVQTDPTKVKWQLFARNLLESKHHILELEDESRYPNYAILIKPGYADKFSCKIEIPSKKHPIVYYSNTERIIDRIPVRADAIDSQQGRCVVQFPEGFGSYELTTIRLDGQVHRNLGIKTKSGSYDFLGLNEATIKCRVTYNEQIFESGSI